MPETPTAEIAAPIATLYLPKVKGQRTLKVYGYSRAKYEFRWNAKAGHLVREYASQEQFAREQLDIHRMPKQPVAVCALLGPSQPIAAAAEAVESLIGARLTVALPMRREALCVLARKIGAALKDMETGQEEPAKENPVVTPSTTRMVVGNHPVNTARHTEEELMTAPWQEVKQIAVSLGVKTSATSRANVAAAILAAEKASEAPFSETFEVNGLVLQK